MSIKDDVNYPHIEALLHYAQQQSASDIHLSSGMPAMIRIDGEMTKIKMPALEHQAVQDLIQSTMTPAQYSEFEQNLELDYAFSMPDLGRFRVNAFTQQLGPAAVFRAIPSHILSLSALQLDPPSAQHERAQKPSIEHTFKHLASLTQGLILITGPTGSGKSTTLAALIDHINETRPAHILTIEDPIEFIHHSKRSLMSQRQVSQHTLSFDIALRSALREDPDVIMVGELRDLTTIRLALTAAETGHLVFATLHTNSAIKTVDRIIDVFPSSEKDMIRTMLSESLQAVISQTLIKRTEGSGRIAAHEILIATPAVRNLIRQNKLSQIYSAMQTGGQTGMITLDETLKRLLSERLISTKSAQRFAKSPESFA